MRRPTLISEFGARYAGDCAGSSTKKGLVIGAYDGCDPGALKLTDIGEKFDETSGGLLKQLLKGAHVIKKGTAQLFTNVGHDFYSIAVAGLGEEGVGMDEVENIDVCKENVRVAAGVGARAIQDSGINMILVESFANAECSAEGAVLGTWRYQDLLSTTKILPTSKLELYISSDHDSWARGVTKAECQNWARRLEEAPGNLMSPSLFAQAVIEGVCSCGVQVEVRDRNWIETKRMNCLLGLARGSCEEPIVLEIGYCGGNADDKPVVFVGQGLTFNTGGPCLKACEKMSEYRGDMAGAAVICAVVKAAAHFNLPMNIRGIIPLVERMVGGSGTRPGDVLPSLNGKSVRVTDTGKEGRVILVDPLVYTSIYTPCMISTVATLTEEARMGLGTACTAVFTTSEDAWREINRAGAESGDRVWRLPFWKYYTEKVTGYDAVDVHNVGKGDGGGTCLGAAFLLEFIPSVDFLHLDITGTGMLANGVSMPYLEKGLMSGRPVRTLIQFLYQIACPHTKGDEC